MRFLMRMFYGTALLVAYLSLVIVLLAGIFLLACMLRDAFHSIFHPGSFGEVLTGILMLLPSLGYLVLCITTGYLIRRVRIGLADEDGSGRNYIKPLFVLSFLVLFAIVAVVPWLIVERLTTLSICILLGVDVCYIGSQLKK